MCERTRGRIYKSTSVVFITFWLMFSDEKLSSAGVLLIRETGSTASIEKLKLLDWNERLKVISSQLLRSYKFLVVICTAKNTFVL